MNCKKLLASVLCAFVVALLAGCDNDGPTSNSGSSPDFQSGRLAPRSQVDEQFNCGTVGPVRVRFSDPGSVSESTATLFYSYGDVPDGTHALNVIWDEDNDPGLKQNVALDQATSPGSANGFVNIEGTVVHNYPEVQADTPRDVRVELTMDGKTGNCSRVLHITLKAPPPPPQKACPAFVGSAGIVIPPGCPAVK